MSRMRTPAPPPRPAEDGLLRCKQLTVLLDWAEQFEAESRQSDEAVAFSVLLGDLNFDNCSLGKTARPPPTPRAPARAHTHTHSYTHCKGKMWGKQDELAMVPPTPLFSVFSLVLKITP